LINEATYLLFQLFIACCAGILRFVPEFGKGTLVGFLFLASTLINWPIFPLINTFENQCSQTCIPDYSRLG